MEKQCKYRIGNQEESGLLLEWSVAPLGPDGKMVPVAIIQDVVTGVIELAAWSEVRIVEPAAVQSKKQQTLEYPLEAEIAQGKDLGRARLRGWEYPPPPLDTRGPCRQLPPPVTAAHSSYAVNADGNGKATTDKSPRPAKHPDYSATVYGEDLREWPISVLRLRDRLLKDGVGPSKSSFISEGFTRQVRTLGDLLDMTPAEVLKLRRVGHRALKVIRLALDQRELKLKGD